MNHDSKYEQTIKIVKSMTDRQVAISATETIFEDVDPYKDNSNLNEHPYHAADAVRQLLLHHSISSDEISISTDDFTEKMKKSASRYIHQIGLHIEQKAGITISEKVENAYKIRDISLKFNIDLNDVGIFGNEMTIAQFLKAKNL